MVVCKFYQQGNCKFGANCKFEHPGFNNNAPPPRGPSGGNQFNNNSNRFDAFQQGGGGRGGQGGGGRGRGRDHYQPNQSSNSLESRMSGYGRGRGGFGGGNRQQQGRNQNHSRLDNLEMRLPDERNSRGNNRRGRGGRHNEPPPVMKITRAGITEDLTTERPIWMMSSYSPTPRWPKQLFEGYDTEQSPEEVRVVFELAKAQGNPQEYIQFEQQLAAEAQSRRDRALNDMDGVMQYLKDGENEHPNRLDIATESEPRGQAANIFAVPDDHPLNVEKYGYPRGRNNNNNNQNNNQQGAFARGQANNQQPQNFAGNAPSQPAFGGAPTSGFGRPAFGAPSQPQNFTTQPQAGQFDQLSQLGGGFNQGGFTQAQPRQQATFGLPAPHQNGGFGPGGGFGQPPNMQDMSMDSGFGNPAQPQNAFGSMQPPSTAFGNTHQPQQQPVQQQGGGFGFDQQPQQQPFTPAQTNGFPAQQPQINGAQQSADINAYATRHPNGQLATWKGQPVQYDQEGVPLYQRPDGNWERIWFPDGPPPNGGSSAAETLVDDTTRNQYGFVRNNGSFEGGVMPVAPPTGDMIRWDL